MHVVCNYNFDLLSYTLFIFFKGSRLTKVWSSDCNTIPLGRKLLIFHVYQHYKSPLLVVFLKRVIVRFISQWIDRTVRQLFLVFDWFSTSRLVAHASFPRQLGCELFALEPSHLWTIQ